MVNRSMESARPNAYDEVPYPSLSYAQTHPDTLATVATLVGMDPPPVTRCRCLELGCAVGGNLIPMAYALPDSEFVGIDYSARQIGEGQESVADLGLRNITLHHLDIREAGPDLGQFDYIIAHGVYAWVPEEVRDKILAICRGNLAQNGVAYVSYNTYPGWRMIDIVRDLMRYHTRNVQDPSERAAQARGILEFMARATESENDAYSSFLQMYTGVVARRMDEVAELDDTLVLHDELEEVNQPVYFYEFAERAAEHGLQYLAEADFSGMRGRSTAGGDVPQPVAQGLARMAGSLVELEQYVDFLKNRSFRRTLLCHKEVELPSRLSADPVRGLLAASRARPSSERPDIYGDSVVKFEATEGAAIATDHPISKVALIALAEQWPRPLPFDALLAEARARLAAHGAVAPAGEGGEDMDARVLAANLLTAYSYSSSLVELHAHEPRSTLEAGEHPIASAVVRFMARTGSRVTNMRHERVTIDGFDAYLLQHLDGSRDRGQLVDMLIAGPVADGLLTFQVGGKEDDEPDGRNGDLRSMLARELEQRLAWMARASLLVG